MCIIGCGSICKHICGSIGKGNVPGAVILGVYDRNPERSESVASDFGGGIKAASSFDELLSLEPDLMVEAASQSAVSEYLITALERGISVMIMSAGALSDDVLLSRIMQLSEERQCDVHIPSGAIGCLDAIRSAVSSGISEVVITTRKPPSGFEGSKYVVDNEIDLSSIKSETVLFEGSARDAVLLFPANVNVAASLSLAGIGFDRTQVRVVADPDAKRNSHEIHVEGGFGSMHFIVNNVPSPDNPKTSYLAALSAVESLRNICSSFHVGT